jgi:hypothetical protein
MLPVSLGALKERHGLPESLADWATPSFNHHGGLEDQTGSPRPLPLQTRPALDACQHRRIGHLSKEKIGHLSSPKIVR